MFGWFVAALQIFGSTRLARFYSKDWLTKQGNQPPKAYPKVSLIIAIKDEADHLAACLENIGRLDYPDLEIIAINDRSKDGSKAILENAKQKNSRLKVVHIEELPAGWLGKCNALHVGTQQATGEYLLFVDGDILFENPSTLKLAVSFLEENKLDHVALLPRMLGKSFLDRCFKSYFCRAFMVGVSARRLRKKNTWDHVGVGAFNLLSTKAYRAIGGHEQLRLTIVDDVMLGKLLKKSGFTSSVLVGFDCVSLVWHDGAWNAIKGLEKNAFAAIEYSVWKLAFFIAFMFAVEILPFLTVLCCPFEIAYWFAVLPVVFSSMIICKGLRYPIWMGLTPPIGSSMMLFTFIRSAYMNIRNGGVSWRDSFYPLKDLKEKGYK